MKNSYNGLAVGKIPEFTLGLQMLFTEKKSQNFHSK